MSPRHLPLAVFLALTATFPGSLRADPSGVGLRVEQHVISEMGKVVPFTRAQKRALIAYVSNNSSAPLDLKVKYVIFGRDTVRHDIVAVGQGEQAVTVKPSITEKVDIPAASATAVEGHYDAKTKKKVDPSGASIIGQGVQVLQGTTVVAEYYDPESLKEEWGKATPMAGAAGAKPAAPAAKPAATPAKKN